ncbi:MAG: PspA/IM30 family protein, partial [Actinomycetota bacterium]|nr:PspA/IM30 family protein [Actinomycetota bacterium]
LSPKGHAKMSVFKRLSQVFQQKTNAALNKVEDPTQALDLSYQKMMENLQQVRRSIADVLTSQKRLEAQKAQLQSQYDKLQGQARQALQQGQDDLARTAVERSQGVKGQIDALAPQIDQLRTQEEALEDTGRKLQAKLEVFRTQRETMKAQYTAAKASTEAVENLSGLSEHMTDVNMMMDRAQDKITQLQARAAAVGELSDSGVLDSLTMGGSTDDIEAQLKSGQTQPSVEYELEAMKAELNAGKAPQAAAEIAAAPTPTQAAPAATPAAPAPTATAGNTMVIRIAGEGLYRVPTSIKPALDALDSAMDTAIEHNEAKSFATCTAQLASLISTSGTKLDENEIVKSDLVVPSQDMTIEEAKQLLAGD